MHRTAPVQRRSRCNWPPTACTAQRGIVLIEALIAILLFSVGVLALVGLQGTLAKDVTHAKSRSEASLLANQLIGQIWVDQANLSSYAVNGGTCSANYAPCQSWRSSLMGTLPAATADVTVNGSQVDITLAWRVPGEAAGRYRITSVVSR